MNKWSWLLVRCAVRGICSLKISTMYLCTKCLNCNICVDCKIISKSSISGAHQVLAKRVEERNLYRSHYSFFEDQENEAKWYNLAIYKTLSKITCFQFVCCLTSCYFRYFYYLVITLFHRMGSSWMLLESFCHKKEKT